MFILGLGIGLSDNETIEVEKEVVKEVVREVPVETLKEVERIVYKDSQETLDLVEYHKATACAFTGMYPPMLEVTKAYANDWGLGSTITKDMYDLEKIAIDYIKKYCN
jgi:hypothetical protein